MDQDQGGPAVKSWQAWKELVDEGKLSECEPEEIVAACRMQPPLADGRLRGQLIAHLCGLARPFLKKRANPNLPNGGIDAVNDIVSAMSTAIVDAAAKDGAGYQAAFYTKLQQRLTDRHRAWRARMLREEPVATDPESGETFEPPDTQSLSPEDLTMAAELVAKLPDNLRLAFQLHRAGFPFSSKGASISKVLGVTPKTAEDWVKKAKSQLRDMLGQ